MRIRTQLIIDDAVLAKIDEIAGEKHRRAIIIDTALREYIAREEKKPKTITAVATTTAKKG
ncbi:MAG: type II toxin-antitoxin system VapB family antitoxin [Pyrinomonadaceae bacterium]